jgi:hypothetical protein
MSSWIKRFAQFILEKPSTWFRIGIAWIGAALTVWVITWVAHKPDASIAIAQLGTGAFCLALALTGHFYKKKQKKEITASHGNVQ